MKRTTIAVAALLLSTGVASAQTMAMDVVFVDGAVTESLTGVSGDVANGRKVFASRKKGNCLACHAIAGGDLPGNIGPPLIAMKARFPDKSVLRAQIYDARTTNPNTIMIPFGPHAVLSDAEIDKITDFIYDL